MQFVAATVYGFGVLLLCVCVLWPRALRDPGAGLARALCSLRIMPSRLRDCAVPRLTRPKHAWLERLLVWCLWLRPVILGRILVFVMWAGFLET